MFRSLIRSTVRAALLLASANGLAATLATDGCPMFHCDAEATGSIGQPLISSVRTSVSNSSLGHLSKQGCSGNGTILSCLFSSDTSTGMAAGTLKVLDAATLQPIWGSAEPGSFNLRAGSAASGQLPVNFADGTIAAGDQNTHVLYSASGSVLGKVRLTGLNENFGLTPVSSTYGIVSEQDGTLTLIDLVRWKSAGVLHLTDPRNGRAIVLVSPSSGSSNVVYAVAQSAAKDNAGFLYSIAFDPVTHRISVGSVFIFTGVSGASPVVVTPDVSGLSANMVLLHVPGLPDDPFPQNRLLALVDAPGVGLTQYWAAPVPQALDVSPVVDPATRTVYYHHVTSPLIYQADLMTGSLLKQFNLAAIGKFPDRFELNSHLAASTTGSVFTLLLGGDSNPPGTRGGSQYMLTFQPMVSQRSLLWSAEIADAPGLYMAGWNFAPARQPGAMCPIGLSVTQTTSTIVRLCDF